MKPVTQPMATSPRGASAEEFAQFTSNAASDIAMLASENETMRNQMRVMHDRFDRELRLSARMIDSLRRQLRVDSGLMASRLELEDLQKAIPQMPAGTVIPDRNHAHFLLDGMSGFEMILEGCTLQYNNYPYAYSPEFLPGATLPMTSRRSLLFGNDPVSGKAILPQDLTAIFTPLTEDGATMVEQTDPKLALTDDVLQPFVRTVKLPASSQVEVVRGRVSFNIPSSIKGSLNLNLIELIPHPLFSAGVYNIQLYSPSGALLQTLDGPWESQVLLPVAATGPTGVGRVSVDIGATYPTYEGGYKVFRYGLGKLGLYEVSYAQSGRFHIYYGTPNPKLITKFTGLEFNTLGGGADLITGGKLRLTIEIPTPDARKYPFGDQRAWQIIYSTDNFLDGYSSSPALANCYFPANGIVSPMPNGWFRIGGEIRMGEGLRPVLSDVLVKYVQ